MLPSRLSVFTLEQTQKAMMQAIEQGPDFLPRTLFTGSAYRIIAGMKVHANTISHARLVALEETFPRVRDLLGPASFNHHSRTYLGYAQAAAAPLADIGEAFPHFVANSTEIAHAAPLAEFDWQWLQAFRAPDDKALRLADLAEHAPEDLQQVVLQPHPAARMVKADAIVRDATGIARADAHETDRILLVRPVDQIRMIAATAAMEAIFTATIFPQSVGNLLDACDEQQSETNFSADAAMQALITLIEAGALREVRE